MHTCIHKRAHVHTLSHTNTPKLPPSPPSPPYQKRTSNSSSTAIICPSCPHFARHGFTALTMAALATLMTDAKPPACTRSSAMPAAFGLRTPATAGTVHTCAFLAHPVASTCCNIMVRVGLRVMCQDVFICLSLRAMLAWVYSSDGRGRPVCRT